ncbi:MAG: hypothetical protein ACKOHM_05745 [Spartobacteria bacterium]
MSWSDLLRPLVLAALVGSLHAESKPAPSASPAEVADFDLPVPEGMPVNGIKVPQYDENGKRLMLFEAAVAKKINAQLVDMQTVKLEALDGEGRKIFVELPQAVFNLESRILTGDATAKIYREDFEITGDSIEFNTKTRFGTMRGNVKMVISTEESFK